MPYAWTGQTLPLHYHQNKAPNIINEKWNNATTTVILQMSCNSCHNTPLQMAITEQYCMCNTATNREN